MHNDFSSLKQCQMFCISQFILHNNVFLSYMSKQNEKDSKLFWHEVLFAHPMQINHLEIIFKKLSIGDGQYSKTRPLHIHFSNNI